MIWSPFPSAEAAELAARTLLEEKLAACVNILPGVKSLFSWQGDIALAQEIGTLIKTDAERLDVAIARLAALHPYETPAIIGWVADRVAPATLAWLSETGTAEK